MTGWVQSNSRRRTLAVGLYNLVSSHRTRVVGHISSQAAKMSCNHVELPFHSSLEEGVGFVWHLFVREHIACNG